jgi:hypothetical protein
MDERTWPNNLYIVVNQIKEEQNDDYQSNQKEDGEMEWVEQNVVEELIHIASITKPTTHEFMFNSVAQDQPRYYVDMLTISIITNPKFVSLIKNLVETLEQFSIDVGKICRIPKTQEALAGNNLLSLPHLPTRRTSGREPLVDYLQSHVVISKGYLTIMR